MQANKRLAYLLTICMCGLVLASVKLHSRLPLGNTAVYYASAFTIIILSIISVIRNKELRTFKYLPLFVYLSWSCYCLIRGIVYINNYFVFNQFIHGILNVLVPIVIFLFFSPKLLLSVLPRLNLFIVWFTLLSLKWNFNSEAHVFCLTPFYYFYVCFFYKIPLKWRIITLVLTAMVLATTMNTSGLIKASVSLMISFVLILPNSIRKICLHAGHYFLYLLPLVLLYLGVTGTYNVFNGKMFGEEDKETIIVYGEEMQKDHRHIDTRTFIYEEMIASAILNNYFWDGRTPARGYYSPKFEEHAEQNQQVSNTDNYTAERFGSEVAHLNTHLWLGLIGLLLITLVYFQGSFLALHYSNNIYVKCLSLCVAFQWVYGWVENQYLFQMLDVMIFIMLSICYSSRFREMSNFEFECWFKSIFSSSEYNNLYNRYRLLKTLISLKLINSKINNQ